MLLVFFLSLIMVFIALWGFCLWVLGGGVGGGGGMGKRYTHLLQRLNHIFPILVVHEYRKVERAEFSYSIVAIELVFFLRIALTCTFTLFGFEG